MLIRSHEDHYSGLEQQDQITFVVLNLANKIRSTFDSVRSAALSCNVLFLDKVADEDIHHVTGVSCIDRRFCAL